MRRAQRIRFDFYIAEMAKAAERILDYAGDISYNEFSSNSLIRDAVIRNSEKQDRPANDCIASCSQSGTRSATSARKQTKGRVVLSHENFRTYLSGNGAACGRLQFQ
jgi:hypothetical protein